MKLPSAFLIALLAISSVSAFTISNEDDQLEGHINDFFNLLPFEEMIPIIREYAASDAEFQAAREYVRTDAFKQLLVDIETLPEMLEAMEYLQNGGIEIHAFVNMLNNRLGIEHRVPRFIGEATRVKITGGLRGFVDDIAAIMPVDEIKKLYYYKLEHSEVFGNFIKQLQSPTFRKIIDSVYANQHFRELLEKSKAAGLDLKLIKDLYSKIIGMETISW